MYPTAVICLFWVQNSFCVALKFDCPATSPKSNRPWPLSAISFLHIFPQLQVVFSFCDIQCLVIAYQCHRIRLRNLPYYNCFTRDLHLDFNWLQPRTLYWRAKHHFAPTLWYDRSYSACSNNVISVLCTQFFRLEATSHCNPLSKVYF